MQKFSILTLILILFVTSSCGIYKKVDSRNVPINAQERARKNVNEGSGISLKGFVALNNKSRIGRINAMFINPKKVEINVKKKYGIANREYGFAKDINRINVFITRY